MFNSVNTSEQQVESQLLREVKARIDLHNGPPEFFRLPKSGGDPYFGLGRSYYYEGEKQGFWRLIRIRQRGKLRGVTLVPYDAIAAFIRKHERAET
jgi:hypothetical protein